MNLPAVALPLVVAAALVLGTSACGGGQLNNSAAPTGGAPPSGSHAVQLSWNPSANAEGYNIYRQPQFGTATKVNSTPVVATLFNDTTVQAGQNYYYYVTAVGEKSVKSS